MRKDQWISFSCNSFIIFLEVGLGATTAMDINNKKTLSLFNNLLQQGSQQKWLHQGWYLCYLVAESIPSSAKFPLAVDDLDWSYLLNAKNIDLPWDAHILISLFHGRSDSIFCEISLVLKKIKKSKIKKSDNQKPVHILKPIYHPLRGRSWKVTVDLIVRRRGGEGEVKGEFKDWVDSCESRRK